MSEPSDRNDRIDPTDLVEQADAAYVRGKTEDALRMYIALLEANPANLHLWYRTAMLLGKLGDAAAAARHLDLAATRLAETGQLLLALAAVQELGRYDEEAKAERLRGIAALYGKGSSRLDVRRRSLPPPLPERVAGTTAATREVTDVRVLREMALDACESAARRWAEAPPPGKVGFHPLFSDLSPAELVAVEPLLQLRMLPAGEVVIEQGAEGRSFFVLVQGSVRVSRIAPDGETTQLARLRAGSFFGEMALLTDSPRVAQVTCETDVLVFELDRAALDQLAARSGQIARVLASYTRERLLHNLMATSPLFRPLDPGRRESLVQLFESVVLGPGEPVVAEGQASQRLYVVLSGSVLVTQGEGPEQLTLAELGPGQIFGEISLIKDRPATATVRAVGKTVLLSLTRDAFNRHVSQFPEVLAHVYRVALEREETNLQLAASEPVDVEEELLI